MRGGVYKYKIQLINIYIRGGLDKNEKSNKIIEKQLIDEYFSRVIKENQIERPEDIEKYSYKMFMQKKFKN